MAEIFEENLILCVQKFSIQYNYMFLNKQYGILAFSKRQNCLKRNKNTISRMFDAKNISARGYVRYIRL